MNSLVSNFFIRVSSLQLILCDMFSIFVSFCIFNIFFTFLVNFVFSLISFYIIGDSDGISYDIKRDRVLNSLKLCLFLSNSERAGIRTPDNLIKSQVLYHLSYTPIYHCLLAKISKITGWVMGFEPTASRATIWRANQLRYTHRNVLLLSIKICLNIEKRA